ncbi:DUF1861 family protein [Cohnella candidum]|uniref:DUF1861 family protein n=1 Tax=Cohnella candidum TaxID=2674991 RepID=A0A3G3K4K8_9BACL|nr:DUF1861 family protein [Cohnella candidum]AYQ75372.1 DUF1861 family protein [Cohnella candidum]
MLAPTEQAKSCETLLNEFRRDRKPAFGEKLIFSGVGTRDVYNISAPFPDGGEPVIAGRVEDRDSEASEVMFFVNRRGEWVPRPGAPVFRLQDPFFAFVQGELVFGGVEVYFDGNDPHFVTSWRTVFYRGKDIAGLKPFAKGPLTMKDIRLVDLRNGKIGVFTRPMMVDGARALIGYVEIADLSELTEQVIDDAELLRHQFLPEEWGGANEAHLLGNGMVGVLGHIAWMENNNIRHYYPMAFGFDPATRQSSPLKLLAERSMFPEGPAKRPDLQDVLFSGGLVRMEDGNACMYTGVSDAESHTIVIEDPFLEYEK